MVDLEKMTLEELKALRRDLTNAIESYDANHRRTAIKELHQTARRHGYTLQELVGKRIRTPKEGA